MREGGKEEEAGDEGPMRRRTSSSGTATSLSVTGSRRRNELVTGREKALARRRASRRPGQSGARPSQCSRSEARPSFAPSAASAANLIATPLRLSSLRPPSGDQHLVDHVDWTNSVQIDRAVSSEFVKVLSNVRHVMIRARRGWASGEPAANPARPVRSATARMPSSAAHASSGSRCSSASTRAKPLFAPSSTPYCIVVSRSSVVAKRIVG